MMPRFFSSALAILLTVTLIAPSAFLVLPQRVHAQYAVVEVGKNLFQSTITALKSTLTSVNTATTAWATTAQQINAYVLQPLAFVLSGNLMKMLTAGIINFVIGKANGTGIPQFVVDVQKSLQTVGDARALGFFDQFGRNSNSPFASSIASSLRTNYLAKTSLAGFWAENMNTLAASTPSYRPSFLTGNWSQGGIAAWFALTTRTENNPYTLYPAAQSKLGDLVGPGVGGATGARLAELSWGQGFASWCGASDQTTTEDNDGTAMEGVNPGDPCTNKDGTQGTIKTPGSVIVGTLNKILGGQQDIITRMGNVGPEINSILGNIATVMKTVNFAVEILGGSESGGLFGIDQPAGSNSTSRLMEYERASGSLGASNASIYQTAASSPISGSDLTSRITQYESAWNSLQTSAETASTSVVSLANYCTAAADTAARDALNAVDEFGNRLWSGTDLNSVHTVFIDAARAQAVTAKAALASTGEIASVFSQAAAADVIIAAARAAVQKVQAELNSGVDPKGDAYIADVQALQAMAPTMTDVGNAQQEAEAFGIADAAPAGSLTVSGGSILDRMILITTNAAALKTTVCNPNSSLYVVQPPGGLKPKFIYIYIRRSRARLAGGRFRPRRACAVRSPGRQPPY